MTDAELMQELIERKALIVHCSRPGKGDEGRNSRLFPEDLSHAIDICANEGAELCCSVIWPGHVETFGDIGIILKPRSTASVTMISTTDGGTYLDANTNRRMGNGAPFSRTAVEDTFSKATDYNEWNVKDADTVGIFVKPPPPLPVVARRIDLREIPDYSPIMGTDQIVQVSINLSEITAAFPALPIFTLNGSDIIALSNQSGTASPYAFEASAD